MSMTVEDALVRVQTADSEELSAIAREIGIPNWKSTFDLLLLLLLVQVLPVKQSIEPPEVHEFIII